MRQEIVNGTQQIEADAQLHRQLQMSFFKENRTRYDQIVRALDEGDIKLAHRLAHNLKGNAGQLNKYDLQNAAADVERLLKNGKNLLTGNELNILRSKLDAVLEELADLHEESEVVMEPFDREKAISLLEQLEPMLKSRNSECQKLTKQLRTIPGAEVLAGQIEDFDFKVALETLSDLKQKWM